jgi:hypothetical protein
MEDKPIDFIGGLLLFTLFLLLAYAGYLSYKSIDWDVLKRMEASPLVLPSPIPTGVVPPPQNNTPTSATPSP